MVSQKVQLELMCMWLCCSSEGSAKGCPPRKATKDSKAGNKEVHAERIQQRKSRKREKVWTSVGVCCVLAQYLLDMP
jgi:hypothetical protein